MKLYNLKNRDEKINFLKATETGLGSNQGLFFPEKLPFFNEKKIIDLLSMDFVSRSTYILNKIIGNEIPYSILYNIVKKSFCFPVPLVKITNNIFCLELFHGPTLAFKDFGARFMSNIISYINNFKKNITILTATSGDTGAAVAHAFYKKKNTKVVILYPKGKISYIQEKLFCNLGKNIITIAINGSFDMCQKLVKKSFNDFLLKKKLNLNSANSINISRLIAQVCYYFEACAKLNNYGLNDLIISVPSGNFGNLTAGLMAKSLGLNIKKFIIATNLNDTVPRFLEKGIWLPKKTINTLSNAMDINNPNNWPRIIELFNINNWNLNDLYYGVVSDYHTKKSLVELYTLNYISEPHSAVAYNVLKNKIKNKECGIFIGTAHPAKFKENIELIIKKNILIPYNLKKNNNLPILSYKMDYNFKLLKNFLLNL
ncbi:threonine synthase [Candidatus Annandia pinicola]|uniref:threonine synthase n=1 Tax=Candidatus Annandia pinicola TaxID=1345117 RepID=UPI001D004F19|nr:threonine synthase [Candidatus Annandia pinicola]UDG80535.1 Threonine synthase [Candidatus Annandia pinicola]